MLSVRGRGCDDQVYFVLREPGAQHLLGILVALACEHLYVVAFVALAREVADEVTLASLERRVSVI